MIYSYTFFNTADICMKQAYHRYVIKDAPFVGSDASRWGDKVHKSFEKRLGDGVALPPDMAKWEQFAAPLDPLKPQVEMKLGITKDGTPCDFFGPDVWMRGKADVAVKQGTAALLIDWKSGKRREEPKELEYQAVMLHARWPEIEKITGHYVWLQDNAIGKPHNVSNVGETLEVLQDKAHEIETNHAKGYWPAKQNPLCGWCPVKSCQFNPKR